MATKKKPPKAKVRLRKQQRPVLTSSTVKEAALLLGIDEEAVRHEVGLIVEGDEVDWLASFKRFKTAEDARVFHNEVEANVKLLHWRRMNGELIEVEAVTRLWEQLSRGMLEALNTFIDRSSPELASLTDPRMVHTYLKLQVSQLYGQLVQSVNPIP